jgi:hypothetical protein
LGRIGVNRLFTSPFRGSIVARARFIEDLVVEQAGHGVDQYVILGAGLDTFARRRPEIASRLRVFEVDQPGPQALKRQRWAGSWRFEASCSWRLPNCTNAPLCRWSRYLLCGSSRRPGQPYKIECFTPFDGSSPFPCHIVDVPKAIGQLRERLPLVLLLFANSQGEVLSRCLVDLRVAVTNEYYCHEAGHVLGRPVQVKSAVDYFKPAGQVAWPLVWVEEFRADLHSYSVAADLLEPRAAAAVFLYNLFARLAGDRVSFQRQTYGYGPIPFLLLALLVDLGFLRVTAWRGRTRLFAAAVAEDAVVDVMRRCHQHALEAFTEPELSAGNPLDWGINAARYYRARLAENPLRAAYLELLAGK